MKTSVTRPAINDAVVPLSIAACPRLASTVRSSITVSGAGNAPARNIMARLLALSALKLPDICPLPPQIGSLIRGAVST